MVWAIAAHIMLNWNFDAAGRGGVVGGVGAEHGRDAPGAGRGRGFNHFGRGRTLGKGRASSQICHIHMLGEGLSNL